MKIQYLKIFVFIICCYLMGFSVVFASGFVDYIDTDGDDIPDSFIFKGNSEIKSRNLKITGDYGLGAEFIWKNGKGEFLTLSGYNTTTPENNNRRVHLGNNMGNFEIRANTFSDSPIFKVTNDGQLILGFYDDIDKGSWIEMQGAGANPTWHQIVWQDYLRFKSGGMNDDVTTDTLFLNKNGNIGARGNFVINADGRLHVDSVAVINETGAELLLFEGKAINGTGGTTPGGEIIFKASQNIEIGGALSVEGEVVVPGDDLTVYGSISGDPAGLTSDSSTGTDIWLEGLNVLGIDDQDPYCSCECPKVEIWTYQGKSFCPKEEKQYITGAWAGRTAYNTFWPNVVGQTCLNNCGECPEMSCSEAIMTCRNDCMKIDANKLECAEVACDFKPSTGSFPIWYFCSGILKETGNDQPIEVCSYNDGQPWDCDAANCGL